MCTYLGLFDVHTYKHTRPKTSRCVWRTQRCEIHYSVTSSDFTGGIAQCRTFSLSLKHVTSCDLQIKNSFSRNLFPHWCLQTSRNWMRTSLTSSLFTCVKWFKMRKWVYWHMPHAEEKKKKKQETVVKLSLYHELARTWRSTKKCSDKVSLKAQANLLSLFMCAGFGWYREHTMIKIHKDFSWEIYMHAYTYVQKRVQFL